MLYITAQGKLPAGVTSSISRQFSHPREQVLKLPDSVSCQPYISESWGEGILNGSRRGGISVPCYRDPGVGCPCWHLSRLQTAGASNYPASHPFPSLFKCRCIWIAVSKLSSNCFLQRALRKFNFNVPKQYTCFLRILSSALVAEGALSSKSVLRRVNNVTGLSSFLACYKINVCSGEAPHNEHLYFNSSLFHYRSASITNLSLDRSCSPMVPAYETSVSPQASRTHMKAETSEDERKILLVPFRLLFVLLCEGNEVCLSCIMQQEYLAAFKGSCLSTLSWTPPPSGAGMENIDAALDTFTFLQQIIVSCGVDIKVFTVSVLGSVLHSVELVYGQLCCMVTLVVYSNTGVCWSWLLVG